jgi:hypothetical protein
MIPFSPGHSLTIVENHSAKFTISGHDKRRAPESQSGTMDALWVSVVK